MLSINSALFIHLVIFLLVVVLCAPLLIKPTMKLIEERDARITGAREQARSIKEENDSRVRSIEERLSEARKKALLEREKIRSEHVKKADAVVAKAREDATAKIADMKQRIAGERESARKTLVAEAQALSREIASRVLGREVA